MRKYSFIAILLMNFNIMLAQDYAPKIISDSLYSESLVNDGGENSTRTMLVYLPPEYEENTDKRYPVIYYLHGFTSSDSSNLDWFGTDEKLAFAFENNKIKPFILVVANQHTLYKGSWYTNSALTGSWADFTAKGLVEYIDEKYRTIADRNSRGICGWSMGGHGTIKMAMLYPEVYSCAYAMSPAMMELNGEHNALSDGFKAIQLAKKPEEILQGNFQSLVLLAMGRTFTPNLKNPPFYADMPFTYNGEKLITHYDILEKWTKQLPNHMIHSYAEDFSKLTAFKIDWGRNEAHNSAHIPFTSRIFSEKLEALGIAHYAEEYIGDHINKIWSFDGRMINNVFPFFDANLEFEEK